MRPSPPRAVISQHFALEIMENHRAVCDKMDAFSASLAKMAASEHLQGAMRHRNQPMGPSLRRLIAEIDALAQLSNPPPLIADLSRGSLEALCGTVGTVGVTTTVPTLLQIMSVAVRDGADPGSTHRYTVWLTDGAHRVPARYCSTLHHRLLPDGGDTPAHGFVWVTKCSALRLDGDLCQLLILEARPPAGYPACNRLIGDPMPPAVGAPPLPTVVDPAPEPAPPGGTPDGPGVYRHGEFWCDGRYCQKVYCKAGENVGNWVDSAIVGVGCSLMLQPLPHAHSNGVWDVGQRCDFEGGEDMPENPAEGTNRQRRWVSYFAGARTRWHDVRGRGYQIQMPACHSTEIRRRYPAAADEYSEGIICKIHPDFVRPTW